MQTATAQASVSLLDVLRARETQARQHGATYLAPVADTDSMLYWLARAATAAREAAGRKQVHIAAGADVDQSSIARFEKGHSWPRQLDGIMGSYADDLEVDQIQIWEQALQLWREHLASPTPRVTPGEVADLVEAEAKQYRERKARSASSRRAPRDSAAT